MSSDETAAVFTDVHSSPNSVVATAPCFAGGGVYVWSQDFNSVPNGNKFKVSATFTVKHDSDSDCVAEVSDSPADLVNIDWTMHLESNGSVSANDSGITDASGVFTTRQFVRDADVYVSSSSLTHGSLTWLSALDLDNPLIVTVP
ncbi:hypothetical protein [Candidatus Lucifugimonas marina]|uniref:Uncharacterized protein n=2 Tax=Candidatus Lucifugimonas marina TaxID=3038979 RepID=A0ABD4XUA7_9CHLR|nr:hypothetical protein [SAR202 cluster bacterium JH702]MDG0870906.1 hypothetical protein [SAR202 cluster bacterium JH639]WFG35860.1 hypothetical protein GKN94_09185 [SAR202 cluster bacterium JH545]